MISSHANTEIYVYALILLGFMSPLTIIHHISLTIRVVWWADLTAGDLSAILELSNTISSFFGSPSATEDDNSSDDKPGDVGEGVNDGETTTPPPTTTTTEAPPTKESKEKTKKSTSKDKKSKVDDSAKTNTTVSERLS